MKRILKIRNRPKFTLLWEYTCTENITELSLHTKTQGGKDYERSEIIRNR